MSSPRNSNNELSEYPPAYRARLTFYIVTIFCTILLMGWGAFVTSINAGLAVPDWPTSFDSYDMFNPWPQWWTMPPVLAEHGHRLLGTLVGILTIGLAVWTFISDHRKWMRFLGLGALALVILQGVLGGLRVVLVSLDLAIIHACVAQIFFATIVSMALFTSRGWLLSAPAPASEESTNLRGLVSFSAVAAFIQIIFGALLRHPGTGIDPVLATTHIFWAFVLATLIIITVVQVHSNFSRFVMLKKFVNLAGWILIFQIGLGFTAYFVLLDEAGLVQPSNLQVIINTAHLLNGAFLMSSLVCCTLLVLRRRNGAVNNASLKSSIAARGITETTAI